MKIQYSDRPSCDCSSDRLMYKVRKRDGELYYVFECRYCRLIIYLEKVEDYDYIRKQKSEYFEEETP
jgi:hypothetical protein